MIILIVCFVVFGLILDVLFLIMKTTVNDRLPEDRKLSWWGHDFRQVNRNYREFFPDSSLPDVAGALWYGLLALFVVSIELSIYLKAKGE